MIYLLDMNILYKKSAEFQIRLFLFTIFFIKSDFKKIASGKHNELKNYYLKLKFFYKKISYLLIFSKEKICEFMSKNYEIIFD